MSNFGVTYLLKIYKGNNRLSIEDNIGEEIHIHFGEMRLMVRNDEFKRLAESCYSFISEVSDISEDILLKLEPIFLLDLSRRGELPSLRLFEQEYVSVGSLLCPVKTKLGIWKYKNIKHSHFLKVIKKPNTKTPFDKDQINYIGFNNSSRCEKVLEECKNNKNICDTFPLFVTKNNVIRDGQHRAAALYYLYGPNHMVKIQRMETKQIKQKSHFKFIKIVLKKMIEFAKKIFIKKEFTKKEIKEFAKTTSLDPDCSKFEQLKTLSALSNLTFFIDPDIALNKFPVLIKKDGVKNDDIFSLLKANECILKKGHKLDGFSFIYGLKPDYLIINKSGVPVAFLQEKMSACSMSVRSFMPLSPKCQKLVNSLNTIPLEMIYILRLLKCMFDKYKNGFFEKDIQFFNENKDVLNSSFFNNDGMVKEVFFEYSDRLIELLRNDEYNLIVDDYRKFEY